MTLFARYYNNRTLAQVSMTEVDALIKDESNKDKIAEIIYHRYYDRYLKIFDYKSNVKMNYLNTEDGKTSIITRDEFTQEYKSGFAIMTACCLLIETISAFFEGTNETRKSGHETFKHVFEKAKAYNNPLECFIEESSFYKNIRCGLLHQGETYGQFKIKRIGTLYDKSTKTINATLFSDSLIKFLISYQEELRKEKWDSALWDKCRIKLRHIIKNSE